MKTNLLQTITDEQKSILFTSLLSIILFWIGLGIGDNMSDSTFWIQSTWLTIKLEWIFIALYIVITQKIPSPYVLWREHQFVTFVSILWLTCISLSYFMAPYYSWQNPLAFMRFLETLSHFTFFLFLYDFFTRHEVNYRIIFTAIILSALVVMSYFIYIHFAFPNLEADKHVFSMRSDKLVLNTHLHRIGYQVEASIAFATAFLFAAKKRYLTLFLIGSLFVFLLWLGGRAAILGSVVTLLICLFYFRKNISSKILVGFGIFSIIILSTAIYIQLLNLDYFIHAFQKTFQAGSLDHLLTGRLDVWSLVLQELQGHWLLGTGPQSYFFYIQRHDDVIHAHNFILQMLGEWGLIGTALFGILLYKTVHYGYTQLQQNDHSRSYRFASGLLILSLTITGLFGGTYFFTQTSVYLVLAFALWVTPSKKSSNY